TAWASLDLEDGVNFHGAVAGQRAGAKCEAGMAAAVAQHVDHQIGGAIDHLWMIGEVRHRVDEAAELHAAPDALEVTAAGCLHLGEDVDGALAGGGSAFL